MDPSQAQQRAIEEAIQLAVQRAVAEASQHAYQQMEELRQNAEDHSAQRQADRDTIRVLEQRISGLTATPRLLTPEGPTRDTSPSPIVPSGSDKPKRKALP